MTVENTELAPTMQDRAGDTEETAEEALELLDDRTDEELLDEATKGKTAVITPMLHSQAQSREIRSSQSRKTVLHYLVRKGIKTKITDRILKRR